MGCVVFLEVNASQESEKGNMSPGVWHQSNNCGITSRLYFIPGA
jgi:hypothetical protein